MQFFGKFGKIVCWRPPEGWRPLLRGILDPPLSQESIPVGCVPPASRLYVLGWPPLDVSTGVGGYPGVGRDLGTGIPTL